MVLCLRERSSLPRTATPAREKVSDLFINPPIPSQFKGLYGQSMVLTMKMYTSGTTLLYSMPGLLSLEGLENIHQKLHYPSYSALT
jgi:hypothetical protein